MDETRPLESSESASAPEPIPNRTERPSPLRRREQAAANALRTLLRDIQIAHFGEYQGPPELRIPLEVVVHPGDNWSLHFNPPLETQVFEHLQEAQAKRIFLQPGRVYCYRCRSYACMHSRPSNALQVFAGYSPTGQPEWLELAQALLQWDDDRTDRLFGNPPEILARMICGRLLKSRQLASFGRSSKTYSILAQTVAGYFPLRTTAGMPPTANPPRFALTFQAVESRTPQGEFRLSLNVITGGISDPKELEELLAEGRGWAPTVFRAREIAVRDLQEIERKSRIARQSNRREETGRFLRQVPVILSRLAESLERGERQRKRRTFHAEERRVENRPVHTAFRDALAIPLDGWHEDTQTKARVAVTPEGRVHLFNDDGRHITSFLVVGPALEHRLRTGRWRKLDLQEAILFQDKIRSLLEG